MKKLAISLAFVAASSLVATSCKPCGSTSKKKSTKYRMEAPERERYVIEDTKEY